MSTLSFVDNSISKMVLNTIYHRDNGCIKVLNLKLSKPCKDPNYIVFKLTNLTETLYLSNDKFNHKNK